jgi:hypothetical protein
MILMAIVLIAILWLFLSTYLDGLEFNSVGPVLEIGSKNTFHDEDLGLTLVEVKRTEGDLNLSELEFIFSDEGNSISYMAIIPPGTFGTKVYSFNFSRDGLDIIPDSVRIVPVFSKEGGEFPGEVSGRAEVLEKPLIKDVTYWNCQSYYNKLKSDDSPVFVDCDNDGFAQYSSTGPFEVDCNDSNRLVHPNMTERCESCFDDNCDGFIGMDDPTCLGRIPTSNIVSHYKFDGNAQDEMDINPGEFYDGPNKAVIGGNITFEEGITCGGNSVDLNNGGYMVVNNSVDTGMNPIEGTISVWFNRRGNHTYHNDINNERDYIFSMYNWTNWSGTARINEMEPGQEYEVDNRMYIYFKANNTKVGGNVGSWPYNENHEPWHYITPVPFNEWHHVVLTYEAHSGETEHGNYSIYLDGINIGNFTYENFTLVPSQYHFGAWADHPGHHSIRDFDVDDIEELNLGREYFNGTLDEAMIFNKSLNATQVYNLWTYHSGGEDIN